MRTVSMNNTKDNDSCANHNNTADGNNSSIYVNRTEISIKEGDVLTGKEIIEKAGLNSNEYNLFQIDGQKSKKIRNEENVTVKNGTQFNCITMDVPYG